MSFGSHCPWVSAAKLLCERLEVRYVDGEIRLRPLTERPVSSLEDVAGCLYRPDRKPLSEEDTRAAIRARLKSRNAA